MLFFFKMSVVDELESIILRCHYMMAMIVVGLT